MVGKGIAGIIAVGLIALLAAGCGGSDSGPSYIVGGSVTGLLAGTSVTLQNNGGNTTPVSANAAFSFSTPIGSGGSYAVTVLTQPTGETCTVSSGSGTVANANVSVAVTCTPNSYSIGGTVAGLLAGNSVVLSLDGGTDAPDASVTTNGAFKFTPVLSGTSYAIAVTTQPTGQMCTVSNGTGTLGGANVTNVAVACTVQTYQINVAILGQPTPTGLVLQNNGGDNLTVSASGTVSFSAPVADQMPYSVTIMTQPTGTTCTVANGRGTVSGANVTNVQVSCPWHIAYFTEVLNSQVGEYFIDGKTGALYAQNLDAADVGSYANSGALDPQSPFLYVASGKADLSEPGEVFVFAIDSASGDLTPVAGSPFAWDAIPTSITVAPDGKYVYTANGSAGTISAYSVNTATGALTEVAGSPFATGSSVAAGSSLSQVTITSDTTFLYAASEPSVSTANSVIYGYTINATTGGLTPITGSPFSAAAPLGQILANPAAPFIYAADMTTGGLYAYGIAHGTGVLSSVAGGPFANVIAGDSAFDPTGKYLYTADDTNMDVYVANVATGAVVPLAGSPFASGFINGVDSTVVDPSGNFVYGFRKEMTLSTPQSVQGYSVNATTGALTSLGITGTEDGDEFQFMAIAALP